MYSSKKHVFSFKEYQFSSRKHGIRAGSIHQLTFLDIHYLPYVDAAILEYEEGNVHTNEPASTDTAAQLVALHLNLPQSNSNVQKQFMSVPTISLSVKLNESNCSPWSRLIQMKIRGQGKLHHHTSVPEPPLPEEQEYAQREQDDLIVCSWMLDKWNQI